MLPRTHPTPINPSLTTLRQDRSRALIRAAGEWDLARANVLAQLLAEHERAGRSYVRLDLGDVTFIDCTCLDVLVSAHRRLLVARGTLVLTGVTRRIARLLSATGLDQVLLWTSLRDLHVEPELSMASATRAARLALRSA